MFEPRIIELLDQVFFKEYKDRNVTYLTCRPVVGAATVRGGGGIRAAP